MSDDIKQPAIGELDWSDSGRRASLSAVYQHTLDYALEAEDWYTRERHSKRLWGQGLRASAIMLGAIAAVLPVVSELSAGSVAPAWSTVALGAAAALVALDRYFGFSSAWMRFMLATQRIAVLRHVFEADWQETGVSIEQLDNDDLRALLGLARGLHEGVDRVVEAETEAWTAEFNSALEQIDSETARRRPPGA